MANQLHTQYVVGIGASAGGLEAIQELVSHLPDQLPNTAIIIAQHLSADYKSMLVELLGRKTSIPVEHIENGMPLEANKIYIAPPSDDVTVRNNAFYLKKPIATGAHPSIDVLLSSLAKEYGDHACGIVLSGTGKDGSRGIVAIHEVGGITIAQNPATAKYEGMPQAAQNTGGVGQVLPPSKIGKNLLKLLTEPNASLPPIEDHTASDSQPQESFSQIFQLLEQRIGIDFSDYKTSTLARRLSKRIQELHFDTEDQYLEHIRQHPEELDQLFEVLLIGVTAFFRDPEAFEALGRVVEQIIDGKKDGEVLRVWLPGCATGEEAYTVAIIVTEALAKSRKKLSLQIFATDIDMKALHKARAGLYPAAAVKQVPKKILSKYFKKLDEDSYEVLKDVRKFVLFSRHDVTANPPFLRLDLISCRNLLIYFNIDLQKKVFPLFYYALNPGGYLLLGKSENIGRFQKLFSVTHSTYKIFQRKSGESMSVRFPRMRPHRVDKLVSATQRPPEQEDLTITEMVKETLYNNYDYPFVVVDDSMDIVEINGEIARYVRFKPGSATLNITKLIIARLQIELRTVTNKAMTSMKTVYGNIHKLDAEDGAPPAYVRVVVKPLLYTLPNNPYFMVIFEHLQLDQKLLHTTAQAADDQDTPRVIELEQELDATKEHMNSLLEELETSNEELQALNEEMQASNEELQASNEELETSNEELQATNEELENAYSELREANRQIEKQRQSLVESTENMSTLLNNTLVGFILIDREYKILAVNKTAQAVYRDLFDVRLKENVSYIKVLPDELFSSFHKYFKQALGGKQVTAESHFKGRGGKVRHLETNYIPATRTNHEKEARYVAMSFVDVTERKDAESAVLRANKELNQEKQFMHSLTESISSLVWTTNPSGTFLYCNQRFLDYVGKPLEALTETTISSFVHPNDIKRNRKLLEDAYREGKTLTLEHRLRDHTGTYHWYLSVAVPIMNDDGTINMWVGNSTDIEYLKKQQEMEQHLQSLKERQGELVELGKVKDQFISLASHQLRTPASIVKQYIGIAMGPEYVGPISEQQRQYLQAAYDSNERQLAIINDLLKTAHLDASNYTLNKERNDIGLLVRQVVDELRPMFEFKQQTVTVRCPEAVEAVFDYEEMKVALANLVENASKYSYPGTRIAITVVKTDGHVVITVKDNGVGIDDGDIGRIFDKFTRVDNELSDTVSGTGLGLYWVKRIIDLHEGNIIVSSKVKQGSKFTVQLPL